MNPDKLRAEDISRIFSAALRHQFISTEDTAVIFYDLNHLFQRIEYLNHCFPAGTLHGLAIKACPLLSILQKIHKRYPETGVEAASIGEVTLAMKAGFQASQIVYDSPVKTKQELEKAIRWGVYLNADNLDELERIDQIAIKENHPVNPIRAGLRINPQVGEGTIAESSVAGTYSKFGVPIARRAEIIGAFAKYPWLCGVHLHVGSQGCNPEMLVEGISKLFSLVSDIQPQRLARGFSLITFFDIGGGLPISYHQHVIAPDMGQYATNIKEHIPPLFAPEQYQLITEFGRWVFTNAGFTVSQVEYVKHDPGINTAMLHVGADLFVRECLNPSAWRHEYVVLDRNGNLKAGVDENPWNLAGPLCFSGDIIAKNVLLPKVEPGDYLVIQDTGSYTFSMWSRYNSRQTPLILGHEEGTISVLKPREMLEELHGFWR